MNQLINTGSAIDQLPEGLANLANGRDLIATDELALMANTKKQTILKHICLYGHFHGLVPIKIGNRWNFLVSEVSRLVRNGSFKKERCHEL